MGLESLNGIGSYYAYENDYLAPAQRPDKKNNLVFVKRPNGKIVVMTKEEFIKYINSRKNPKKKEKAEPYELGPQKGGRRLIDVESVTDPLKPGTSAPKENACPPQIIEDYERNIDVENGIIDDFRQGRRGDCYLLSSIESIKRTKDGQDILSKNIQQNEDGSYLITLPGAVAVRNHYIEQGYEDKCAITGQYKITKEAVEKAKSLSGKSYAYGDINVILIELAMEAFRAEIIQTNKALGKKSEKYIAGQICPRSDADPLSGGMMYDAIFILTGQKSDVYEAPKSKRKHCKLYKPREYGYVGEKRFKSGTLGKSAHGIVEVNHVYNKESDLQKMLDRYKGKEGEYSITVGVIVAKNGPDGSTKAGGGHALTVTKITDEYVEVVNPWDTTKAERIPRGDFEQMAVSLNVAPVSKKHVDKFYSDNRIGENQNNNDLNLAIILNPLRRILNPFFPQDIFRPQIT